MHKLLMPAACLITAIAWHGAIGAGRERPRVVVAATADAVAVTVDGKPFTTLHAGTEAHKPYLHPLLTASGKNVTRAFPMEQVAGESTDLPHQRGVWIGTERLSGVDFWENEPSYDRPNTYQPSPGQERRSSPSGRRVKKTRDRKK
jgi:hypothetical protein